MLSSILPGMLIIMSDTQMDVNGDVLYQIALVIKRSAYPRLNNDCAIFTDAMLYVER